MHQATSDTWIALGLRNIAVTREWAALAMGGRRERWHDAWVCDAGSACPIANSVSLLRPLAATEASGLTNRLDRFFGVRGGGSWVLWSGRSVPDLSKAGFSFWGEPPLLLRLPGGCPPPMPRELRIVEAHDAATIEAFETVLVEGMPLRWLQPLRPGTAFDTRVLGGPLRLFVGFVEHRPVSVSMACVASGVVGVYAVATLPEARSRGYGAALTWRATTVEPRLPALLQSSEIGQSVYERLGYTVVTRLSLWERARLNGP
jgi:GNAT superfamily N-acetyltransferase